MSASPDEIEIEIADTGQGIAADLLPQVFDLFFHETRVAHEGAWALSIAAEFRPHVMVLDIGLPGMDGYEVARRMRGRRDTAGVLLIALTGYGRPEDALRIQCAGFDHHLVKAGRSRAAPCADRPVPALVGVNPSMTLLANALTRRISESAATVFRTLRSPSGNSPPVSLLVLPTIGGAQPIAG